jgi:hypothetical protein
MQMTEGKWTQKLLQRLRAVMPEAYIIKHHNYYTSGIPDFSITIGYRTTFWEIKVMPNRLTALQAETIRRLGDAGHVITATADGKRAWVSGLEATIPMDELVEYIIKEAKGGDDD